MPQLLLALRRPLVQLTQPSPAARSLFISSPRNAAAAAAAVTPFPSAQTQNKTYGRRLPIAVKRSPASSSPSTSTSDTRFPRSAPSTSAAASRVTGSSPSPSPGQFDDVFDDVDLDMDPSPTELGGIDDYAPPSSPSSSSRGYDQPAPSAPLTSLPSTSYTPLPLVSDSTVIAPAGGIPGESTVSLENDWSVSFAGLSQKPFEKDVREALMRPLGKDDVEIKPDGLLYLPEIKYRRTLNLAFGPGGWGLAPRGETNVGPRIVSREWALICLGRLVSIARGEQEYFDPSGVPTATEACKSNALMRCCKDLGIASELWDPSYIRDFKAKHCVEVWVEHATQKKKRKQWRKKDAAKFDYPYKETGIVS